MADDVYTTINSGSSCARSGISPMLKREPQLFPANGPLKFVVTDILGILLLLPHTLSGNHKLIVMTDR